MKIISLLFIVLTAGLSGCAPLAKMPFSNPSQTSINQETAIYLITANISNLYKKSFQPELSFVNVAKESNKNNSDRIWFESDEIGKDKSEASINNSYLIRMELPKGKYELKGLSCTTMSFPVIATFFVPILQDIIVENHGIFYLGHIEANVRERQGEELRAGHIVPFIDQAIAGASTGTFDIEITDQWLTDENKFRSKFPPLANVPIQKNILAPFDKNKAQLLWEKVLWN